MAARKTRAVFAISPSGAAGCSVGTGSKAQGRGVGLTLLSAVLGLAKAMAVDFGCIGLVVYAKPQAVTFYERYGFMALEVAQGQLDDRPELVAMLLEIAAIPATTDSVPRD